MESTFLAANVWRELTKSAKTTRQRADVAVAYFGSGASQILPLPKGSRLVVDASERAVTSGQTCPMDLLDLRKKGVRIYSAENLHAKVYVFGNHAFIGSANASKNSANVLFEAMVRVSDPSVVEEARNFVGAFCLDELGPKALRQLQTIYRPPRFPPRKLRNNSLPRLLIARLTEDDIPVGTLSALRAGEAIAKKKNRHQPGFEYDTFWWSGPGAFRVGDTVLQFWAGEGSSVVYPPAKILHISNGGPRKPKIHFIHCEMPALEEVPMTTFLKYIPEANRNRVRRSGVVGNKTLVRAILSFWEARKG